ncbi:MAG: hypothetical protein R2880_15280 [Deinococcales bacterium]
MIRSWGKKIIIIVNKLDYLRKRCRTAKVLDFVKEQARQTLDTEPRIFGLEARNAYKAKEAGNTAALAATGLKTVESYITENVVGNSRMMLKMKKPFRGCLVHCLEL